MNIKAFVAFVTTFVVSASVTGVLAQQPGKRDSLRSSALNEERYIQIVLPQNYKAGSNEKYDVLYVLDGDDNTRTAADVEHFIEIHGQMPPVIIVGVLNTDRNRDLTPTHSADNPTSGGAAKFLAFLKDELIPYINKTYPSNGNNVLFGHSFGGLFVTYALLNEPQAFRSYIAADPSYWWDNNYLNKVAEGKLPSLAGLGKTLYISGREGEAYGGMGIVAMKAILKTKAPADFIWKDMAYADETHGSVRLKSIYDGLRFTYAGYDSKAVAFHPMNGWVLKDKPFRIWFFDDTTRVRYTTDGSLPTSASNKITKETVLTGPGKFIAKHFSNTGRYDVNTVGEFKESTVWPALATLKESIRPGGFKWGYYEGTWDKLPDFGKLTPVKTGYIDSTFSIDKFPRKENFGLVIEGYLEVKEDGYCLFALSSDDGSKLYLGNHLLIDFDGLHGSDDRSCIAPLQKGFYPFRLEYFQKDGGRHLDLQYVVAPATIPKPTSIPRNLQYSEK